jgi:hypothetical protein
MKRRDGESATNQSYARWFDAAKHQTLGAAATGSGTGGTHYGIRVPSASGCRDANPWQQKHDCHQQTDHDAGD